MSKVDPEEFRRWARAWLRSRTFEWWEEFAARVNKGRPQEDWFELPAHLKRQAPPVNAANQRQELQPVQAEVQTGGEAWVHASDQFSVAGLPLLDGMTHTVKPRALKETAPYVSSSDLDNLPQAA
jgi:hypothetical protein